MSTPKWNHIKLGIYDRRRCGLSDIDKENIRSLHRNGTAIRAIARLYAHLCSRRLITFIIHPDRLKTMQEKHKKAQHWKKYFNRKKLTEAKRNWMHYKSNLYKKQLIK